MKIYIASSWKNRLQDKLVVLLRDAGYDVYDFKNPAKGIEGFQWESVDLDWQKWGALAFVKALGHPRAEQGYQFDMNALNDCDVCILLMDSGRSAHLELGYAVGSGKKTIVFYPKNLYEQPELMWKMADSICLELVEVLDVLESFGENIRFEEQMITDVIKAGKCPTCGRELTEIIINGKEALMCPLCQIPLDVPDYTDAINVDIKSHPVQEKFLKEMDKPEETVYSTDEETPQNNMKAEKRERIESIIIKRQKAIKYNNEKQVEKLTKKLIPYAVQIQDDENGTYWWIGDIKGKDPYCAFVESPTSGE